MSKFHANPETGEVGPCGATKVACPFGEAFHGESAQAAEKAYANSLAAVSNESVEFGTLKKNRAILTDPANAEVVAAARAVYSEIQSLDKYKKRDDELARKLSRTLSSEPEFQEMQNEKVALEEAIADLDPDNSYKTDPSTRTVPVTGRDDKRDFQALDQQYQDFQAALVADETMIVNEAAVKELREKRDLAATRVGQPTIAEVQQAKRREFLNNSLAEFDGARAARDPRASFIARNAQIASTVLKDEDGQKFWGYMVAHEELKDARKIVEERRGEPLRFGKRRAVAEAQDYAAQLATKVNSMFDAMGGNDFQNAYYETIAANVKSVK